MRQISNEFAIDPTQSITVDTAEMPQLTAEEEQQLQNWMHTKTVTMAHSYCLKKVQFLSGAKADGEVISQFNNCLGKYSQSWGVYNQERQLFVARIQGQQERGEDIYAHFNQH